MPSCIKKRLSDGITKKFFHGNLHLDNRSRPFKIVHVFPHGPVEAKDSKTGERNSLILANYLSTRAKTCACVSVVCHTRLCDMAMCPL
ncbi:hypothetical protein EPI10_016455 [Gossypium australe]|uniref:Uncharacterized protein n=1 Tax=Gossypium australe TaxID=47621 RepID=A0A5B6VNN2_9ROSI|nr:hypothetical protein EPI10_016455 [Gossypium australe]